MTLYLLLLSLFLILIERLVYRDVKTKTVLVTFHSTDLGIFHLNPNPSQPLKARLKKSRVLLELNFVAIGKFLQIYNPADLFLVL